MKPVESQIKRHEPDEGQIGDCFRAVIASWLEMESAEVPHFMGDHYPDYERSRQSCREWLHARGLTLVDIPVNFGSKISGVEAVDNMVRWFGEQNEDAIWKLTGLSKRGFQHCVLCRGPEIVWDPTYGPDEHGLVGPVDDEGTFWITLITRI